MAEPHTPPKQKSRTLYLSYDELGKLAVGLTRVFNGEHELKIDEGLGQPINVEVIYQKPEVEYYLIGFMEGLPND